MKGGYQTTCSNRITGWVWMGKDAARGVGCRLGMIGHGDAAAGKTGL